MEHNKWWKVKHQSLAVFARSGGFDLAIYDQYPESVQKVLKDRAISEAMLSISYEFEDLYGFELSSVRQGIYVISLSNPLSVQYGRWWSPVIYIGMGNIYSRIEDHFKNKLFELMQSLSGANFDFAFSAPFMSGEPMYYKHVEHMMLEYFSRRAVEPPKKRRYPILNSNAGANKNIEDKSGWWNVPLKSTGKKPLWSISPTIHSDFQLD